MAWHDVFHMENFNLWTCKQNGRERELLHVLLQIHLYGHKKWPNKNAEINMKLILVIFKIFIITFIRRNKHNAYRTTTLSTKAQAIVNYSEQQFKSMDEFLTWSFLFSACDYAMMLSLAGHYIRGDKKKHLHYISSTCTSTQRPTNRWLHPSKSL